MSSPASPSASAMATEADAAAPARVAVHRERAWPLELAGRVLRDRFAFGGTVFMLLLVVLAVAAPLLSPYDAYEVSLADRHKAPSAAHLFGTDEFGRDLLTRIIYGGRISLMVGFVAALIGALIGVPTGMLGGYFGGWVDTLFMRAWDVLLAFPPILLGLAIVAVAGPGAGNVVLAVGIVSVPAFARLARSVTLTQRGLQYIEAARTLGATDAQILRHILPNILPLILVQATVTAAYGILLEAALSFLGVGSQPPEPSWGTMLNQALRFLNQNPWYGIFPGLTITALVLSLNFVAETLRDALDPTLRRLS